MRHALSAAWPLAAAIFLETASATPALARSQTGPDATLAAHLSGGWTGQRYSANSAQIQHLTMTWHTMPNGQPRGAVTIARQKAYPVNVVWSAGNSFIYESAPHLSRTFHERVVVRGVAHFSNGVLRGTFEARPTRYEGSTITGTFSAARTPDIMGG